MKSEIKKTVSAISIGVVLYVFGVAQFAYLVDSVRTIFSATIAIVIARVVIGCDRFRYTFCAVFSSHAKPNEI